MVGLRAIGAFANQGNRSVARREASGAIGVLPLPKTGVGPGAALGRATMSGVRGLVTLPGLSGVGIGAGAGAGEAAATGTYTVVPGAAGAAGAAA
ncbi:MAG: hypothetical protein WDO74_23840 [Pseudomonadota bacterium]